MDSDGDFVITWDSNHAGTTFGVFARRYNSSGVAQGVEFLVNTSTTGEQINTSIAMDSDGDFAIAWESYQDGDGYGVYAQRYNASGVVQGGELQINSFTTGAQSSPSIAMDDDGDFVITWHSNGQDGSLNGVYAQRYNAAGATQGAEFKANAHTTSYQQSPSVAMDSDGDFVIAWQSNDQDGSVFGVYGRRYDATGVAQGSTEFLVNSYTTDDQSNPSIAMESDGDFGITWQGDTQDGSQYGVFAHRYHIPTCEPTTNLVSSNLMDNSADLSWDAVAYASSYEIRYHIPGVSTWQLTTSSTNSKTITGLGAGTNYQWKVKTVCAFGKSGNSATESFTTTGAVACPVPTNLSDASVSDTEQDLDWDDVTEADHYEVHYRVKGTSGWIMATPGTSDLSLTTLTAGTLYQWKVRSVCVMDGSLVSDFTVNQEFTTTGTVACAVPSNLGSAQVNDNEQSLTWDAVTGAVSYETRHRVMNGAGSWINTTSGTNSLNLTSLQAGTTYLWRIRSVCAMDGSLVSLYSSKQIFTTSGSAACAVPTNPVATPVTQTSEDLSWTAVTGAITYEIRYKVKGAAAWIIVSSGTNSLSLTGLSAGTTYSWKVNAVCAADGSVVSQGATTQIFVTNGSPACATPTGLSTSGITANSADISWGAVTGAVDYKVDHRISGSSWITNFTGGAASTTISGLNASTNYQWRVRAICSVDGSLTSANSIRENFTTAAGGSLIATRISLELKTSTEEAVNIYSYRDKIFVKFRDMDVAQSIIHIYGIDGRMSHEIDNRQSPQQDLELKPFLNGTSSVQIVRILLPEGVVTKRVMVRR